MQCAIRIPANESLERDIVELLTRPVGRPSQKPVATYKGLLYQNGELEDGAAGGSEGGVPVGGDVPPSPIHRDQPVDGQSGCGPFLQQARHGGALDQRRQQAVKMRRLSCHYWSIAY